MKHFEGIKLLKNIKENLQKETHKVKNNSAYQLMLMPHEEELFFKRVDIYKFLERISTHYNLDTTEKVNKFLGTINREFTEKKLITIIKNKEVLSKILSNDEKLKLKNLYLTEYKNDVKRIKEEELDKNNIEAMESIIISMIDDINKFLKYAKANTEVPNSRIKTQKKLIKEATLLITTKSPDLKNFDLLKKTFHKLNNLQLKRKTNTKKRAGKHGNVDYNEVTVENDKEIRKKVDEFHEKEHESLLKRIRDRKEEESQSHIKSKDTKEEKIVIEAFLEDFDSEKSRFALSVLSGININISFYTGVIRLINDDGIYKEIYFNTVEHVITFFISDTDISLDLKSNNTIGNVIQLQSSNDEVRNTILNCLSVLYFINTFYTNDEKVDISYEKNIKHTTNTINTHSKSIIYLKSDAKAQRRTIKIKKGKLLEGKTLTRGHWRRQPYSDGEIKLIWIEPFWRGKGITKEQTYKITNTNLINY